jgi:hypothetical protein
MFLHGEPDCPSSKLHPGQKIIVDHPAGAVSETGIGFEEELFAGGARIRRSFLRQDEMFVTVIPRTRCEVVQYFIRGRGFVDGRVTVYFADRINQITNQ